MPDEAAALLILYQPVLTIAGTGTLCPIQGCQQRAPSTGYRTDPEKM
jgi:hypothetical protein